MIEAEELQAIRARAQAFAHSWAGESSEQQGKVTFWDEFFTIFGLYRRQYAIHEFMLHNRKRVDLFWKKILLVEHKGKGLIATAFQQALDYIPQIAKVDRPAHIVTCDFEDFYIYDLNGEVYDFRLKVSLAELPSRVEDLSFMLGHKKVHFAPLDELNFAVVKRLGSVFDMLQADHYLSPDLFDFMIRLVFCMFADHTGIFERNSFATFLKAALAEDKNIGGELNSLFATLDTSVPQRSRHLAESLRIFPWVNGKLFSRQLRPAPITQDICEIIINVANADWRRVSPAIFGALFQCVMDKKKRANLGEHYTSEANILRALRPLFLDELHDELLELSNRAGPQRTNLLRQFRAKLSSISILDPACGCGNFLVVAYRELRMLDIAAAKEIQTFASGTQQILDTAQGGGCSIASMYGIEIEGFPCRVAEVALWMIDHLMNVRASEELGRYYVRLPLDVTANIRMANALLTDWGHASSDQPYSYIVGNPPFLGAHRQTAGQKADLKAVFGEKVGIGDVDYVAGWFVKAAAVLKNTDTKAALVATSSIAQGEQVSILWSAIKKAADIKISFGYKSFKWSNEAPNVAQVHVVIIGFQDFPVINGGVYEADIQDRRKPTPDISPYLTRHGFVLVHKRTRPIADVPPMVMGNKPTDDGELLLNQVERDALVGELTSTGLSTSVIRPYIGTTEFLTGTKRWCLWFAGVDHRPYLRNRTIAERIAKVRAFRLASTAADTINAASTAHLFFRIPQPSGRCIIFPETTSENREYVPVGRIEDGSILSNGVFFIPTINLYIFGVLSSKFHQLWLRQVGGRLENRIRYAPRNVYNTFPFPDVVASTRVAKVEQLAADLIAAQDASGETFERLYEPKLMPDSLKGIHAELDKAVEKCFQGKAFQDDDQRIDFLFDAYKARTAPLDIQRPPRRPRARVAVGVQ
jgi:hypothetical protein